MIKNVVTRQYLLVIEIGLMFGILANLVHPITPAYLLQIELPDTFFGYFFAAMNLGMLISAPLWGAVGDTKKRHKILVLGFLVYALGQTLFGFLTNTWLVLIARVISGFGSGAIAVSTLSYVANSEILVDIKQKSISAFIVANVIGTSIGSALGGIIGNQFEGQLQYVMYLQAIMIVVFSLILLLFQNMDDEIKGEVRSKNPLNSLKDIKQINGWYLTFLTILMIIGMNFVNISKYLDKYFTDSGKSTLDIGIFNALGGVVILITNLLILPKISKHFKPMITTILFTFICFATTLITFNLPGFTGIYSVFFVYLVAKTILEPASVNYLSQNTEVSSGVLLGIRQSFLSLGSIIGIIVAGYIYDYEKLLIFNLCGFLFLFSGIILIILNKKAKRSI